MYRDFIMCKKNKRICFSLSTFVLFLALYGEEEVITAVEISKPVAVISSDSSVPTPEILPINSIDTQLEEDDDEDEDAGNLATDNNESDADINSFISQNILLSASEIEGNSDDDDEYDDDDEI